MRPELPCVLLPDVRFPASQFFSARGRRWRPVRDRRCARVNAVPCIPPGKARLARVRLAWDPDFRRLGQPVPAAAPEAHLDVPDNGMFHAG